MPIKSGDAAHGDQSATWRLVEVAVGRCAEILDGEDRYHAYFAPAGHRIAWVDNAGGACNVYEPADSVVPIGGKPLHFAIVHWMPGHAALHAQGAPRRMQHAHSSAWLGGDRQCVRRLDDFQHWVIDPVLDSARACLGNGTTYAAPNPYLLFCAILATFLVALGLGLLLVRRPGRAGPPRAAPKKKQG